MSIVVDISGYKLTDLHGVLVHLGFDVKDEAKNTPNAVCFGGGNFCILVNSDAYKSDLVSHIVTNRSLENIVAAVSTQLGLSFEELSSRIGFAKSYLRVSIRQGVAKLSTKIKIVRKLFGLFKLSAMESQNPVEHVGTPLDNLTLIRCGELNNLRSANAELEAINDEYLDIIAHQEKHRGELIEKFDGVVSFMTGAGNEVKATLRKAISERDRLKEQLRKTQIIAFILLVACVCLGLALGVAK